MKNNNKTKSLISLVIMFTLIVGLVFSISHQNMKKVHGFEWLFNNDSESEKMTEEDMQYIVDVYNSIQQYYVEDVSKEQLLEGALKGMVNSIGDPHSEFLNAQETESMNETVEGSFQGVGIQIMSVDNQIVVVTPIEGTPASQAGIQPNDIVLEADGTELTGMDTNSVVELIRGQEGTTVKLVIQRGDATFDLELERAEIPIVTVTGELDKEHSQVGSIKISQFNGTTYDELVDVVTDLRDQGATSFVFDLRYNPGGLLDQGLAISNMFLQDDDIIMQMEESGDTDSRITYVANDKEYGDFQITEPYVLLINEGSASASEIVAAAIQENTDAPILGTTSFGKGSVQTVINQSDLGELKITFAKWLTPSGEWIHDKGITPTTEIKALPIESSVLLNSDDTLSIGDGSDQVQSLTYILDAFDYEVTVGSFYDEYVQAAVEQFQKDNDLEVTGEVTGETASLLNARAREFVQENDAQYDEAVDILMDLISEDQAA